MLGFNEFFLVFIIVLFIFGPNKLPELGKIIGNALGELKKAQKIAEISNEFQINIFDKYKNDENLIKLDNKTSYINSKCLYDRIYKLSEQLNINTENKNIEEILNLIFDKINNE